MPSIRFQGLVKTYGHVRALDGIDLDIASDSLTVLCGPPASGKSVLLRILVGLESPDTGRILVDGVDITGSPAAARRIGYVPQSFALFPHMSVFDNVAYPLALQGAPAAEQQRRVDQAADVLRIRHLLGKRPSQLSGGEKQRAAIARGILKDANIFLLDDPLVGLDFKLRESLMEDLTDMRVELGATFLYATADPLEALTMAQHLVVLDAGRVVDANPVARLYSEPQHLRAAELVGFPRCNVLPGRIEGDECVTDIARFPAMLDRPVQDVSAVIRAEDIVHVRGDHPAQGVGLVRLLENLGGESVVHFSAGEAVLTTTVPSPSVAGLDLGDPFPFALHPAGVRLFDRASGVLVGRGRA